VRGTRRQRSALKLCSAAKWLPSGRAPSGTPPAGIPLLRIRGAIVADDWEDMTVDDKLDHLLSKLGTLERRLEEVLIHLSDLSNAVEAIELKLRQ
jgi:hypothetical protein